MQDYFSSQRLPLFDQATFTVGESWAATNIVLALGLKDPRRVATHVKNAQSALTDLLTKDADAVCVQVVLGLCMVFQESPNLQAASILLATAVTLVHRLKLQNDLFWIAYILDKSIHLRAQQPPHLLTVVDLPVVGPFRARAELAVIQASVYHTLLYSGDIQPLEDALHAYIPSDADLHWSHLYTLAMIYRAHSHNQQWLHSVMQCESSDVALRPLPRSWARIVASARNCMQLQDMPTWYVAYLCSWAV